MATDENSFRFALLAVAVVQSVVSLFYMRRAKASSSIFRRREEGIPLTILMGVSYLGYCWGIVAYLIDPAWMSWSAIELPVLVRWMGGGPLLLGAFMILWGLHHLSSNFAFCVSPKESNTLVTSGPYRFVRHPLYSAFAAEAIGIALLTANWFVAFCGAALWLCIVYRTPMEEEKLIERFGEEYRQHMTKTGRYFPKMKRGL